MRHVIYDVWYMVCDVENTKNKKRKEKKQDHCSSTWSAQEPPTGDSGEKGSGFVVEVVSFSGDNPALVDFFGSPGRAGKSA